MTTAAPILDLVSALGDETRTRILVLLERGEFNVSELCAALQLPQPTVSRHLRTLSEDGWVASRAEGRMRHYRFSEELGDRHRQLWELVRDDLGGLPVYAADAERARGVLSERRRRSAAFFAASADRWEDVRRDLYGARAEFLPLLGFLDPRWTVGELGVGTGGLAATLAPFVERVVGVDRSPAMLDAARARLEGHRNVELREGELES
ncbi:MAG TPA: metalloregulator ArsR/SmtB family transcription factor, partial [Longimicrobiales bacterium]|nr:metalloregulator ArsR/SmtB family transcription factor [Longimicrobiales bacterium]